MICSFALLMMFASVSAEAQKTENEPAPAPVQAADAPPPPAPEKTPDQRLDAVSGELDDIATTSKRADLKDEQLVTLRERIPPIQDEIDAVIGAVQPQLDEVNARVTQLGTMAEGESVDVAAERDATNTSKQQLDDALKRAKLLDLKSKELTNDIAKKRRDIFASELYARTPTILGPTFWGSFFDKLPTDWARFSERLGDGWRNLQAGIYGGTMVRVIFSFIVFVLLCFPGIRLVEALGRKIGARFLPVSRLRRTLVAIWSFLATATLPTVGMVLLVNALLSTGTVSLFMKVQLASLVVATRVTALMFGLSRAFLAPHAPDWRLVHWTDEQVARIHFLPLFIGLTSGLRLMAEHANDALGTSLQGAIVTRTLFAVVSGALIAITLWRVTRIRLEVSTEHHKNDAKAPAPRRGAVPVAFLLGAAWIVLVGAAFAVFFGYNALGIFWVRQLHQIAVVTLLLQLATMLTDDLFDALLGEHFPIGRFLRRAVGVSASYMSQIAVALAGVARIVLIYIAIRVVILRMSGDDVTSVTGRIQDGISDLTIGEVTISPSAILGAFLVFAVVIFATRAIQRWLDSTYLPHTQLDSGARNSIGTGIGYVGFIGAVLLAIAYLGVSFDKVALIASALSVGIGFGLQQIISNFVSGLILLVERPIKVGDLVSVSGSTGDVKKISVRATEILLGDGSTFVVPNSELISKPVVNKTRVGVRGQVQFLLRISYGEDPNRARAIVLDAMRDNDKLLKDPPPAVFIDDVDDRGYVFNIVGNTKSPRDTYGARSDLFFELTRRLRKAGIAIGSPISSVKDPVEEQWNGEQPPDEGDAATAEKPEDAPDGVESADDRPAMGDGKGAGGGGGSRT